MVGSSGRDRGARSLQRMVRRAVGSVQVWKKNLRTLELAGDSRMTGDRKVELAERMELPETKGWLCRDVWQAETPNCGCVCVLTEPRGDDAELASEVK